MKGLISNIKDKAKQNHYFREVLETGKHTQVVIMSIPPGEEIGEEVHSDNDQVLYLVKGTGDVYINGERRTFKKHDLVLVHAGDKHNFINTGEDEMKVITTYSPPHHPQGTVHKTNEEAKKED